MAVVQRFLRALILLPLMLCVLAQGGCRGTETVPQKAPRGILACRTRSAKSAPVMRDAPEIATVSAGEIQRSFAVTSGGQAVVDMPLVVVPGRAGVEPRLSLYYESGRSGGGGVFGEGFSIAGLSSITRCPGKLTDEEGEIRAVRFDAEDKLCLDSKPLVVVGEAAGIIEFRLRHPLKFFGNSHEGGKTGSKISGKSSCLLAFMFNFSLKTATK